MSGYRPAGGGTGAGSLTVPTFISLTEQIAETVIESGAVTVTGADNNVWPAVVRGDGGAQLQIAGGAWAESGLVLPGDSLRLRLTSGAVGLVERTATLHMPGVSHEWSVTTAAVVPWAPTDLPSLVLWMDAADASTITVDSGTVAAWADKSPSGRVMSKASAPRPQVAAGARNGLDVLRMDGTVGSTLSCADVLAGSDYTVFVVSWMNALSASTGPLTAGGAYTNAIMIDSGNLNYSGVSGASRIAGHSGTQEVVGQGSLRVMRGGALYTTYFRKSGGASIATRAVAEAPGTGDHRLGLYNNTSAYNGDIAEIIFYAAGMDLADIEVVEGYLAHKWGLAGELPALHPYKVTPP